MIVSGKSSWRERGWQGERDEENRKRTKKMMNQTLIKVTITIQSNACGLSIGGWQAHLETAIILVSFWSLIFD